MIMEELLKLLIESMKADGSYVDTDKIDGKICLDGWFTPRDLIRLGTMLERMEKGDE